MPNHKDPRLDSEIHWAEKTPEAYDGRRLPKGYADEYGQWQEPSTDMEMGQIMLQRGVPLCEVLNFVLNKKVPPTLIHTYPDTLWVL